MEQDVHARPGEQGIAGDACPRPRGDRGVGQPGRGGVRGAGRIAVLRQGAVAVRHPQSGHQAHPSATNRRWRGRQGRGAQRGHHAGSSDATGSVEASAQKITWVSASTWRATGRRSRSYESSRASPRSDAQRGEGELQPRFAASWMPMFIPWPTAGDQAWAASPARKTWPCRNRSASRCWSGTGPTRPPR